jgi:hypothetical protein
MTGDKYDLPTSSLWILGLTALVAVLAIVIAFAQALGALATSCPGTAPIEADAPQLHKKEGLPLHNIVTDALKHGAGATSQAHLRSRV